MPHKRKAIENSANRMSFISLSRISRVLILLITSFHLSPLTLAEGVTFVQNQGQWPNEILFRANLPGGFLFLKKQSLHYVFYDTHTLSTLHAGGAIGSRTVNTQLTTPFTALREATQGATTPGTIETGLRAHGVEVALLNSQREARLEPINLVSQHLNYFLGNDPSRWATAVPSFSEVIYRDIYPGIDLRLFAYYQTLKYEFIVKPGVDPSIIQLDYQGANSIRTEEGKLVIETSLFPFREDTPVSFSEQNGKSIEVPTDWILNGTVARFHFPKRFNPQLPLIIDPTLVFSTYSGAGSDNWGHTATYDKDGNLYTAGTIFGVNFSATRGAFQVRFGGELDVEVMKFSPDGKQLLYAAFLGGSTGETPNSLVVTSKNELIVYGVTSSLNFPLSASAYSKKFAGGRQYTPLGNRTPVGNDVGSIYFANGTDLFLTKISPNGQSLLASTYVGGSDNDGINDILQYLTIRNYGDDLRGEVIIDDQDNVYVSTISFSADFPTTPNAPQRQRQGTADAVIIQMNPDLSQLQWSTYFGGSGYDVGYALRRGASGSIYVTGATRSSNLPATSGSFKPTLGGNEDGFLAKFVNGKLERSTYIGTSADDAVYLIDLDAAENPHLFGLTRGNYSVSADVYRNQNSGQFIHALDPTLSRTVFSTVIGSGRGIPDISPTAFLVNECGNIYLSGWGGMVNTRSNSNYTSSTRGLPITADAFRRSTTGNNYWLGVLEKGAKSLLYATFFGGDSTAIQGDHVDGGTCRFDKTGVVYHAACACGGNHFPSTPQAWSSTNNSTNCNNAAFKFSIDRLLASFDTYKGTQKSVVEGCSPLTLTFINTSEGGKEYDWDFGGLATSKSPVQATYTFDKPGEYIVTLKAYNKLTCKQVDISKKTIKVYDANFKITPDTITCPDKPVQLQASGANTYKWSPAQGLSSTDIANPVATVQKTTQFTVTLSNGECASEKTVSVKVDESYKPTFLIRSNSDCGQSTKLELINQTKSTEEYQWTMGNGDTLKTKTPSLYQYAKSGHYEITLTSYKNGCSLSTTLPIDVENLSEISNVVTANNDGKNDYFTVGFTSTQLEIYNRWGRLVYRSTNYSNEWGPNVPHGLYYYLLTTPGGIQCKGWVEVIE